MEIKIKIAFAFVISVTLAFPIGINPVQALNSANSPATVVIGQQGFGSEDNCQNAPNQGSTEKGFYTDTVNIVVNGKLIVSDSTNNRVLIYNSIPTSNNPKPDVVIGQPNFCSTAANQGQSAPAANTLYAPRDIYSDGTKLIIVEQTNHRVLIYNTIPTTNNASADVVIGQQNFTSNSANQGGAVAANTLNAPYGAVMVNEKLFIADTSNNRVLIYDHIPTENNHPADHVIGQADMIHNTANQGSRNANTLSQPFSLTSDGTQLLISDFANSRVLIYTHIPTDDNHSADFVIGQTNMTSGSANQSGAVAANKLKNPYYIHYSNGKLFVADTGNHRVLIYNSIPGANNVSANLEIGQADMSGGSANRGGSVAANTLSSPRSIFYNGSKIFIIDSGNYRLLIYNSYPAGDGASADVVVGQPDMTSSGLNQNNSINSNTLYGPKFSFYDGSKFFVSDYTNNRVLIYNSIPTSNNATADVVIGQADMTHGSGNQGGTVNSNTLSGPMGVFSTGEKLIIPDYNNNRVLIYNHIPTENNHPADYVIGQVDMTHGSANQSGSVDNNKIKTPWKAFVKSNKLYIVDDGNHRVLIYNHIPEENNHPADNVIGQADMTHGSANRGLTVGANTLNFPTDIYVTDSHIFIADSSNNRILIYNSIPTDDGASADVVVGQPNMTSNSTNQGNSVAASNTLYHSRSVYYDNGRLFVGDYENHRVLVFNSLPTSNDACADVVVGHENFSSILPAGANRSRNLYYPIGIGVFNNKLAVSDFSNNRVAIYPLGPQNQSFAAPSSPDSRSIALTLGADDAKDVMMSEDSGFSGASWESYAASKNFTLSKGGGSKTVYVKMRDYANYEGSTLSQSIALDNVIPVVNSNQSSVVAAGTTEVTLSVNTSKNTTCKYSTDSSESYESMANTFSSTGGTTHTTNVTGLTDGNTYNYYVKCDDPAGNEDSYTITFAVSPTEYVPTIFIGNNQSINLSPTEQAVTRIKEIAFRGTLTDNDLDLGKVELRKDGKFYKRDRISKKGKWRIPTKDNAKQKNIPHTYQFVYYDKSGNIVETSNTYTILIDRQKPNFTKIPRIQTKNVGDTVTFGATDNDQVDHYDITFRGQKSTSQTPEFVIPQNTPSGISVLSISAVDRAGNIEKLKIKVRIR